jgi:hypothetical protein
VSSLGRPLIHGQPYLVPCLFIRMAVHCPRLN